jgi:phosphoribosyl 1,2-cyclic phosphate phosphodiesterase
LKKIINILFTQETIEVVNNQLFSIEIKTKVPCMKSSGLVPNWWDFAYLTDVKTTKNSEIAKLKNLKVLVINALREEPQG